MAARVGDRGAETVTVTGLRRGTGAVRTVPGDGMGNPDLAPRNAERSAANYGAALGAKFGHGQSQRSK
jgi:hypothetical protein